MPLYMDIHKHIPGLTAEAIKGANQRCVVVVQRGSDDACRLEVDRRAAVVQSVVFGIFLLDGHGVFPPGWSPMVKNVCGVQKQDKSWD